jgi:hypothetical protein
MRKLSFTQWLYRGQRPNWIVRILNLPAAIVATFWDHGQLYAIVGSDRAKIRASYFAVGGDCSVEGQQYLVSMLGDKAQWVLNVRAAGGKAVIHSGRRTTVQIEEVPPDQRAPILKAYLERDPICS